MNWDVVFIYLMVLEVIIEAYQIGKNQGKLWVNLVQIGIYVSTFLVYTLNRGQGSFPFGLFLRGATFAFIIAIILEVSNFSLGKVEKGKFGLGLINLALSLLKFLPLILLILFLTDSYM